MRNLKSNILKTVSFIICLSTFLCGCGSDEKDSNYKIAEEPQTGISIFGNQVQKNDAEIYFFDVNNLTNADGTDASERLNVEGTQAVGSSDCYLIKSGDVEVLVDCGIQTYYINNPKKIEEMLKKVLLPKLASLISSDGILDYLIVTHGDFDHISGLSNISENDYGLFDAFLNQDTIISPSSDSEENDSRSVKLSHIRNIIDFESDLVHYLEKGNAITSDKNVFFSESGEESPTVIENYFTKRNKLIEFGQKQEEKLGTKIKVQHYPVSRLFLNKDFGYDKKLLALCDYFKDQYYTIDDKGNIVIDQDGKPVLGKNANQVFFFGPSEISHMDKEEGSDVFVSKTISYKSPYSEVDIASLGSLENDGDRYFFNIPLTEKVQLRILYNQFYDFFYQHSINSQDRNNISVMLEIVDGNGKMLSLGDAGGNAENGVCNYYENSDVLKRVMVFKASHHGSTYNHENSGRLFLLCKPQIIVIPGVARIKDSPGSKQMTYLSQDLFANVISGNERFKYIFCTNIGCDPNGKNNPTAYPFYGDIHVGINSGNGLVGFSNSAEIAAYLNSDSQNIKTQLKANGKILSMEATVWFAKTGWSL